MSTKLAFMLMSMLLLDKRAHKMNAFCIIQSCFLGKRDFKAETKRASPPCLCVYQEIVFLAFGLFPYARSGFLHSESLNEKKLFLIFTMLVMSYEISPLPLLSFLLLHLTSVFLWYAHIIIYVLRWERSWIRPCRFFVLWNYEEKTRENRVFVATMLFIHVIHYARVRRPAAEFECVNGENRLIIETKEPLLVALNPLVANYACNATGGCRQPGDALGLSGLHICAMVWGHDKTANGDIGIWDWLSREANLSTKSTLIYPREGNGRTLQCIYLWCSGCRLQNCEEI